LRRPALADPAARRLLGSLLSALLLGLSAAGCLAVRGAPASLGEAPLDDGVEVNLPFLLTRVARRKDGSLRECVILGTGFVRGRDDRDPSSGFFLLGIGGASRVDEERSIRVASVLPLFALCRIEVSKPGAREASFLASWPLLTAVGSWRSLEPGSADGGAAFSSIPLLTTAWSLREGPRERGGFASVPLLSVRVRERDGPRENDLLVLAPLFAGERRTAVGGNRADAAGFFLPLLLFWNEERREAGTGSWFFSLPYAERREGGAVERRLAPVPLPGGATGDRRSAPNAAEKGLH